MIGFSANSPRRRGIGFFAAAALAMAMALAACGRNGDPLPPPEANAAAAPKSDDPTGFSRPSNPPIVPPKRPFLLDPLLSDAPAKAPQ